jgi:hypothetical protein
MYSAGLGSVQAYDDWTDNPKRELGKYPLLDLGKYETDMKKVPSARCCSNEANKCGLYDAFMNVRNKTTYVNERAYISEQAEKQMNNALVVRPRERAQQCCFFHLRHNCGPPTSTAPITRRFSKSMGTHFGNIADSNHNKTILFIGDSISHQTFEAAACSLNRHGFTEMFSDCAAVLNEPKDLVDQGAISNKEAYRGKVCCTSFVRPRTAAYHESATRLCYSWDPVLAYITAESLANIDIVLFNAGLWFNNIATSTVRQKLQNSIEGMVSLITDWKAESPHKDRIAIFRGSTPQHFEGSGDGRFPDDGKHDSTRLCVPHTNTSATSVVDDFVTQILPAQVYFLPVFRALAGRWDAHRTSWLPSEKIADCTHFCGFPLMWEVLWDRLHLVLLHAGQQVP